MLYKVDQNINQQDKLKENLFHFRVYTKSIQLPELMERSHVEHTTHQSPKERRQNIPVIQLVHSYLNIDPHIMFWQYYIFTQP